jgi:hypothetical protein
MMLPLRGLVTCDIFHRRFSSLDTPRKSGRLHMSNTRHDVLNREGDARQPMSIVVLRMFQLGGAGSRRLSGPVVGGQVWRAALTEAAHAGQAQRHKMAPASRLGRIIDLG